MAKHLTSFAAIDAPVGVPLKAIGDEICKAMDAMVRNGYVIKAVVPHVVPHCGSGAVTEALSVTAGYLVLGVLAEHDGDHGPLGPGMVVPVA